MAVTITIEGTDRTANISRDSVRWKNKLTNRVDMLDFEIKGQTLPFTLSHNDEVVLTVDGVDVFGGRVIEYTDIVEASQLKTRRVKCKDYSVEMDNFYYSVEEKSELPLYNLIRDLLHSINKRMETRIAEFETDESWSAGSADTTNYRLGSQSRKITSAGSYVTSNFSPSATLDLSDEEYIVFDAYIDDASVCAGIRVRLGDSGLSNYYEYEVTAGFEDGWNHYRVLKTAFSSSGSPDWSAIDEVQVAADATGTDTVNVSFDDMYALDEDGFTMDNVDVSGINIPSVKIGTKFPTDVMKLYSKRTGYDWYVDASRDIHMFSTATNTAPFELTDTAGTFNYDTLKIVQDISKLRNVIKVFGGKMVSTSAVTEELGYQADGVNTIFQLGSKYDIETVTLEVDSVAQDVGIEGTNTFAEGYDALYNVNESTILFDTPPGDGVDVTWEGKRITDLVQTYVDSASVAIYGEKEIVVKEPSITTVSAAIQRALAEFTAYAGAVVEGSFETDESGLFAGQRIHVDLDNRGIDDWYIIQEVTGKMRTEDDMTFSVKLVSTKQIGLIETMQKLLALTVEGIEEYETDTISAVGVDQVLISEYIEADTATELEDEVEVGDTEDTWLQTAGEGGDPFVYVAGNYECTSNTDTTRTPCADGGAVLAT